MESPKEKKNELSKPKDQKSFMKYYGLAFELALMNILLILGGYHLDKYLNSSPVFVLSGTFLSMAGTIILLIRFSK